MELTKSRTWAEINLNALGHNYRALRQCLPRECRFLGVVKANAYGHGALPVAERLVSLGAEYLAVACLDEALELRQGGIAAPILILGHTPVERGSELVINHITQTVFDGETAHTLSKIALELGEVLCVHLKLDTGMSRLGWLCDEVEQGHTVEEISALATLKGLNIEGIFTHFSDADGSDTYTELQFQRFMSTLSLLESKGMTFKLRHCANSATVLNYPHMHLDMVRPGIALYGHYPDPSCKHEGGVILHPVMEVKSRVASVKEVSKDTPISYGRTHYVMRTTKLAAVPIGYADGLFRLCSNQISFAVGETQAKQVGRICMDMCMIDVTDLPQVAVGDEVSVYGGAVPIELAADVVGTIQYELLCAVSRRVPRIYLP